MTTCPLSLSPSLMSSAGLQLLTSSSTLAHVRLLKCSSYFCRSMMSSLAAWGPVPRKEKRSRGMEARIFWRFSGGSKKRAEREVRNLSCGSAAGEQMDSRVAAPATGFLYLYFFFCHIIFISQLLPKDQGTGT